MVWTVVTSGNGKPDSAARLWSSPVASPSAPLASPASPHSPSTLQQPRAASSPSPVHRRSLGDAPRAQDRRGTPLLSPVINSAPCLSPPRDSHRPASTFLAPRRAARYTIDEMVVDSPLRPGHLTLLPLVPTTPRTTINRAPYCLQASHHLTLPLLLRY